MESIYSYQPWYLSTLYSSLPQDAGMHYFVVDCRPVEHFSCGHLPGAFHLDANLVRTPSFGHEVMHAAIHHTVLLSDPPCTLHAPYTQLLISPTDFSTAADRLCAKVRRAGVEGGEHLCFLGSGREQEDQYANMVIAKFLQKSIPYVSLARGGFLGKWGCLHTGKLFCK